MAERYGAKTRRSTRITLRVPLKIYEWGSKGRFCVEEAYSVKVSLWGGLVACEAPLNQDQKLLVLNQTTVEIAESQVVYLGSAQLGKTKTGGLKVLKTVARFLGRGLSPAR